MSGGARVIGFASCEEKENLKEGRGKTDIAKDPK